jgi:hypothetical protein
LASDLTEAEAGMKVMLADIQEKALDEPLIFNSLGTPTNTATLCGVLHICWKARRRTGLRLVGISRPR